MDSRGVRDLANDRILIDVNYHHLGAVADVQAAPRRINGKVIPPAVATNRDFPQQVINAVRADCCEKPKD